MECINLRTANPTDRVALRGVRMHAVLAAMSQKTIVEQTFINRESFAIEAVYTFPLPDGAAVCAFEVITGDRVLTGVIEETDNAIEKYETAISEGHAAYLAEQERPDVFTIRVGNIKPQQAATVRLTYICALDVDDNQIRVTFPTTVAPRFASASGMDPLGAAIDGDALNPPHVLDVPYGLTFSADVRLGRKVKTIASPSHTVEITGDDREGYLVSLPGQVAMDREVVLTIDLAKEVGPSVQFENGKDNQSFLAVTFVPEFEANPERSSPTETVFVLDCSGSMAGSSIQQAIEALELCLRGLNAGDTFNICKFGSSFEMMNHQPVVYSQATLDQAIAYIATGNSLGGTELFQPLEVALRTRPGAGVVRSVILLTDGQVSNEPALLNMARRHRSRNRIFSFGIGPASSQFLVKGLARATGGAAEFISQGESIHEKVLRQFARLASPLAADVQIDWAGAEAQTLAEIPPVFDGEVLTIFARILGRRPAQVTLKCKTDACEQSWPVAVPTNALSDSGIATMWARRTIQSLEEGNGITRSVTAPTQSRDRDMLISISKEFGLLSSLTTFVAIEHRSLQERNEGQPASRRVPVTLAAGWGNVAAGGRTIDRLADSLIPGAGSVSLKSRRRGVSGSGMLDLTREADDSSFGAELLDEISTGPAAASAHAPIANPPTPAAPSSGTASPNIFERFFGKGRSSDKAAHEAKLAKAKQDSSLSGSHKPKSEIRRRVPDAPTQTDLSKILMRQSATGDFHWDERLDEIASTVSGWSDLAAKASAFAPVATPDRQKVISTLWTLVLLQNKFAADEGLWKRAAEKAIRYVATMTAQLTDKIQAELKNLKE